MLQITVWLQWQFAELFMQFRKAYAKVDFSTVSYVIITGTTFWTLPHSLYCTLCTGDHTSAIGTLEHVHKAVERQGADRFARHRAQWPVGYTSPKLYSPCTLTGFVIKHALRWCGGQHFSPDQVSSFHLCLDVLLPMCKVMRSHFQST